MCIIFLFSLHLLSLFPPPYPPVSSNHDVMIFTDFHPIVNSETHIQTHSMDSKQTLLQNVQY